MTDRTPFLREYPPDRPADSACEDCKGRGFYYDEGWARTCHCRYSADPAGFSQEREENCSR